MSDSARDPPPHPQPEHGREDHDEDAEAAWLAAGKREDVECMRALRLRHPRTLALDRAFATDASDDNGGEGADQPPRTRVSDWSSFPLATLGDSAMHAATWNGSLEVMRFLLEQGQHPDARDNWKMTPIMVTIMRHALPLIRSVFRGREAIPRHLAMDCRKEDEERTAATLAIVKLLLEFGADLEARDYDGRTALMLAGNDDAFDIVKLLLDAGADVNAQDKKGWSALRHSVEARSLLTTNMLLERGANIDLRDKQGVSPLSAAIQRRRINKLQLFINHYALVSRPSRLDFVGAVFLEAVDLDAFEAVNFLLRDCAFASVQFKTEVGETAFHFAKSGRMVKLLAQYDTEWTAFRARTALGDSCMHYAVRMRDGPGRQVLRALLDMLGRMQSDDTVQLEAGAVLELLGANAKGVTPLYEAAMHPADALIHRSAKCAALLAHDAPLFPESFRLWSLHNDPSGCPSTVEMVASVRSCLRIWLLGSGHNDTAATEDDAGGGWDRDILTLCLQWVGCVDFGGHDDHLPQHQKRHLTGELVAAVVFAGYAQDVVPLLLELPLRLGSARALLEALHTFLQAHQQHAPHAALLRLLASDMTIGLDEVAGLGRL